LQARQVNAQVISFVALSLALASRSGRIAPRARSSRGLWLTGCNERWHPARLANVDTGRKKYTGSRGFPDREERRASAWSDKAGTLLAPGVWP